MSVLLFGKGLARPGNLIGSVCLNQPTGTVLLQIQTLLHSTALSVARSLSFCTGIRQWSTSSRQECIRISARDCVTLGACYSDLKRGQLRRGRLPLTPCRDRRGTRGFLPYGIALPINPTCWFSDLHDSLNYGCFVQCDKSQTKPDAHWSFYLTPCK